MITLMFGCAARHWARWEERLRVKEMMCMGKDGKAESRADTTEPPYFPVAPTMRYFFVAISVRM
jgi:hypothetical protein